MPSALDRGDIDGFFGTEPFGHLALAASGSKVHVLTNADGYINGYAMLGARTSWLDKNQDAAKGMIKALYEGSQWSLANPDAAKKLAITVTKLDSAYVDQAYAWSSWPFAYDQKFYADYKAESAFTIEAGLMKQPVNFSSWIWSPGIANIAASRVGSPPSAS